MKAVICPNAYKGTFTSKEASSIIGQTLARYISNIQAIELPLCDGGDGSLDCLVKPLNLELIDTSASDAFLKRVPTVYGINKEAKTAVIEVAKIIGLSMIEYKEGNALLTSSFGVGELINDAINKGMKNIIVCLGGSSTNDAGVGMMEALGVRFLNSKGENVEPIGKNLEQIESIDLNGLYEKIKGVSFTILSDVNNPLVGPKGATRVYGPQKGANGKNNEILEEGMKHYASVLDKSLEREISSIDGSGAAGGLGSAFIGFLKSTYLSGADSILNVLHFDELAKDADFVVTGEGKLDMSSLDGKLTGKILDRCFKLKKPVYILAGSLGIGFKKALDKGTVNIICSDRDYNFEYIQSHKTELLIRDVEELVDSLM